MEEDKISIEELASVNGIDVYDKFDKDGLMRKLASMLESLSYR